MLKIYKASAGSGKTYTLAYEYIRNLLGIKAQGQSQFKLNIANSATGTPALSNRHRHILAITFTNKATEEMKRRIIDELDAISTVPSPLPDGSMPKDAPYAKDLCSELHCSRTQLAEAAAAALRQLLYDYHSFNVTTIDSFFQRVLRTFARELDRQGDFSIELNDKSAVQKSVDTMIDDFNNNNIASPKLGQWILEYMTRQLQNGEKTNFFNRKSHLHSLLVSIITRICEEKFKPYAAEMKAFLADSTRLDSLVKHINARKTEIIDEVAADTKLLIANFNAEGADLDGINGRLKLPKLINDYFAQSKVAKRDDVAGETFDKLINGETEPFKKTWKGTDAHRGLFNDYLCRVQGAYVEYYTLDDILRSLDSLGLLAFAWQYLDNFSAEYNTVLLSDTNHLLAKIIGEEESPFIYERMGMQLNHFLIDEFQDTSQMQWDNIKPLMTDAVAFGHDSLIIGDEKQSIYRFRNSDSSLLHEKVAADYFPAQKYDTRIFGNAPGQNTNYRSSAEVVQFNNTLFEEMAKAHGISGFENVIQDINKIDRSGYVTFTPVFPPDKDEDETDEGKSDSIAIMAENMRRQHSEGKYAWSDMAVLVATNAEAATVVDRLLQDFPDIPVLSDEALYVKKSPAIQTIIGVLKILANELSHNKKTAPTKSKYPTPSELAMTMSRFEYFRSKGETVEDAINHAIADENHGGEYLSVGIDAVRSHKPSSLIALIETIIHEQIPEAERSRQIAYLNAFQDFVSDYCSRFNPSVKAFLDNWETHKDSLTISSATDVDAVKVMTIHKSKGLEFDCVHIPFGSWKEAGRPRGQWLKFPEISGINAKDCPPALFLTMSPLCARPQSFFHEQYVIDEKERMVDTMNMTYVAYTRAGAELAVYYNPEAGIGKFVSDAISACGETDDPRKTDLKAHLKSDGTFELGTPTVKQSDKNNPETDAISLDGYDVYFHESVEVLTHVTDMLDLDTDITEAGSVPDQDPVTDFADEEARLRGILLHDTLSLIDTPADIDKAVLSSTLRQRLTAQESADLKKEIETMLSTADARVSRWFGGFERVLTEQTLYIPDYPEGDNIRRPDRIVFLPDGSVEIIDYKFTSKGARRHQSQVGEYIGILKSMGYPKVTGYLWYPLHNKIQQVTANYDSTQP